MLKGTVMATRDNGKGDTPRPIKDKEQFDKNWDAIFKNGIPTLAQLEKQREEKRTDNPRA